jgi:hypothetical protein
MFGPALNAGAEKKPPGVEAPGGGREARLRWAWSGSLAGRGKADQRFTCRSCSSIASAVEMILAAEA